jgi:hypothetical protein
MTPPTPRRRATVRLLQAVTSDLPVIFGPALVAPPGLYVAELNALGAAAVRVDGKLLGIKPGEFEFVDEEVAS